MSFDPNSSDLQFIWDTYVDFESFTREIDRDLNHFIEEWKDKVAKAQSAGCQYSDILLGLKLIEKVNLNRNSIVSVISKLGSPTFKSENFLAQVVTKIKEEKVFNRLTGNEILEQNSVIRSCKSDKEILEQLDIKNNEVAFPVSHLKEEILSNNHPKLHSYFEQDKNLQSKEGSRSIAGFLKCPICNKNFMLTENLDKHIENHDNVMYELSDYSSVSQEWIDYTDTNARSQNKNAVKNKVKKEVESEAIKKYDIKNGLANGSKSSNGSERVGFDEPLDDNSSLTRYNKVPCEICGRYFAKNVLKRHMLTHTTDSFKCSICLKECEKLWMLKRHMKIHSTTKDVNCSQCDKTYKDKDGLRRHILKMHSKEKTTAEESTEGKKIRVPKRRFPCEVCGRSIARNTMNVHLKAHSSVAELQCHICPKKYKKLSLLKKHIETHKYGQKALECSICQKEFKNNPLLKIHMETHRTTRDFICSYCGKKFKTKGTLREHLNVHTKAKKLPCEMCDKVFFSRNSLKFHVRAHHTGEKPYKCDFCDKKFYTSTKRMEHMRIHTGEKPFPCHVCGKYFRGYSTRRRHIINVHKEAKPNVSSDSFRSQV